MSSVQEDTGFSTSEASTVRLNGSGEVDHSSSSPESDLYTIKNLYRRQTGVTTPTEVSATASGEYEVRSVGRRAVVSGKRRGVGVARGGECDLVVPVSDSDDSGASNARRKRRMSVVAKDPITDDIILGKRDGRFTSQRNSTGNSRKRRSEVALFKEKNFR